MCQSPLERWQTHVVDDARPWRAVFVDSADLDGDGFEDIVTGAWWYRNPRTPAGVWERREIGAPLNQMAVIHDFDGDGDLDVLGTIQSTTNSRPEMGNEFVWARNDGSGTFTTYTNIDAGSGNFLQGALAGTFEPGGPLEVMLSWHNEAGGIERLTVPADAVNDQWTRSQVSTTALGEDLSAGDIDRDGRTDLSLGTVWLRNQGAPWPNYTLATATGPDRNRLVDLNADGRLDVAVGYEAVSSPGTLAWYEAPADPTTLWTEHVLDTIIGPMSLDVGDADGDGDPDVVAGEHNQTNPQDGRVFIYENAAGSFTRRLVATGDEHHAGTQFVDIDNDGDLDVISIGWSHGRVLLYEQVGCPEPPPTATPSATPTETQTPTVTPTPSETPTASITPVPSETPTASNTPPATETPTATATATSTPSASATPTATATSPAPAEPNGALYVSSTSGGTVSGIKFADEDILRFDLVTNQWSLYFDGSDVGLATTDVNALEVLSNGDILLSIDKAISVPGIGLVDDSDIIRFRPTGTGPSTAGAFSLYFDGSDVDLSADAEDVDGIAFAPNGTLLISVLGRAAVSGVAGRILDEDLLAFDMTSSGADTAGTWSLYFDGSDVGLSTNRYEDINGVWSDAASGKLYLSTVGNFSVSGAAGQASDLFGCAPGVFGPDTACVFDFFWDGGAHGYGAEVIDAVAIEPVSGGTTPAATATATATPSPTPTATASPVSGPTYTPTATSTAIAGACVPIGDMAWDRYVIDADRPGRAVFAFTFDVDGDGRTDLLTGKFWYRNPGNLAGAWERTHLPSPLEDTAAAYDFDGDGDLDLFGTTSATLPTESSYWAPFVWLRNEGSGVFTVFDNIDNTGLDLPPNDPIQGVAIDRYALGGPLEIAVTWDDTENPNRNAYGIQMFSVPADPTNGTWTRRKLSDLSLGEQLSAVDVDDDGDRDLFLGAAWLRNDHPAGTWTLISIFPLGTEQSSRHKVIDIDSDGDLDAFIGYSHDPDQHRLMWYEQLDSPESPWQGHLIDNLPIGYAESMDVVDVDGDGDVDIILGEYNLRSGQEEPANLFIYENLGQGASWTRHTVYFGDSHYQSSQAADMDGDGDLDIVSKGWRHARVHLYENRGASCPR